MRIVIPDDYQDAVRHLACFETLAGHQVTVYHDHTEDVETLATRFQGADAWSLFENARLSPTHFWTLCSSRRMF